MNGDKPRLEKAKERTLVDTNAQAVFEGLRSLRELAQTHRRRWIWELLQNAADAAKEPQGNSVRVRVQNGRLVFAHNGAAFTEDEICCLIYHGSTKNLGPTKSGKYGSGFLTIHLVAEVVTVRGMLNQGAAHLPFHFELDRTGRDADQVRIKMEEAWCNFLKSLDENRRPSDFTTEYECELKGEACKIVDNGLDDLRIAVPYVLCFASKLRSISLESGGEIECWRAKEPIGRSVPLAPGSTPSGAVSPARKCPNSSAHLSGWHRGKLKACRADRKPEAYATTWCCRSDPSEPG